MQSAASSPQRSSAPSIQIGVDTGGTFTDLVMLRHGEVYTFKTPSTPDDYARGILIGLQALLAQIPITEDASFEFVHASTVATNALLERKGARTALVTTQGFRDVLEIGRQQRPHLYDLYPTRPEPLVARALRHEVAERVDAQGHVLERLRTPDIDRLCATLQKQNVQSVAVCLLFSFLAPDHEQRIGAALREAGFDVSLSSEILPEFREYERTSTTVINAYVAPVMKRYLQRLAGHVRDMGAVGMRIVQSNGGSLSDAAAAACPVHTLLSGPAAGLTGAQSMARIALKGFKLPPDALITFDMGGTSTDVALIAGEPGVTTESTLAGFPVHVPMVDLHTVGAGGGSIASLDGGGALHVGPASAGADPGPACYGRGTEPTVTDANLVAGRLPVDHFLGGRMKLHPERAHAAVQSLAARMNVDLMAAAEAILRIVNANMVRAVRVISIERGHDPRRFTLVSFGGAGGLHACQVAEALHMTRVLVPRHPGVLSAWGALAADVVKDYATTLMRSPDAALAHELSQCLQGFAQQARDDLHREGIATADLELRPALDLRYEGQSHELTVPHRGTLEQTVAAFHELHAQRYGHASPKAPVQLVTVRLRAMGRGSAPQLKPRAAAAATRAAPRDDQGCPCLERDDMPMHRPIKGPCLILEAHATTHLPKGWSARADAFGNLLLERP
jgi:N-methylhydantoinase A